MISLNATVRSATAPIPFREDPAVGPGQLASTFLITVLLLAAFWGAARYARKKGWLDRWTLRTESSPAEAGVRIIRTQRVSRQTVIHTVLDRQTKYLLVESKLNISITPLLGDLEGSGAKET